MILLGGVLLPLFYFFDKWRPLCLRMVIPDSQRIQDDGSDVDNKLSRICLMQAGTNTRVSLVQCNIRKLLSYFIQKGNGLMELYHYASSKFDVLKTLNKQGKDFKERSDKASYGVFLYDDLSAHPR